MSALQFHYFGTDLFARFGKRFLDASNGQGRVALARALRQTGPKARTAVVRSLVPQTGLKNRTINRAVKVFRGDADQLSFTLLTRGGNIKLKHFGARETRAGVSAAPRNQRKVFKSTFQRAGWWGRGRVVKGNWNGQVFENTSLAYGDTSGFVIKRSDVYIPEEMLRGATVTAWRGVIQRDLLPRVEHELKRLIAR